MTAWVSDPTAAAKTYGPIEAWDTSKVTEMSWLFCIRTSWFDDKPQYDDKCVLPKGSSFNEDIGDWDVSAVTDMNNAFHENNAFNQDIGKWNTRAVTSMEWMFNEANAFNKDIGKWDVGAVTDMLGMFYGAYVFNQNIGEWNTGSVTSMNRMFLNAFAFNQDIGDWNVAKVYDMRFDVQRPLNDLWCDNSVALHT